MRRPRLRLVLGLAIPLLVVVVLLAAWAIDSSSANGKVPRNTTLANRAIGKMPEDALAATVADLADQYADAEVQVRTTGRTYKVAAAKLGLRLDESATTKAALELDDQTALPSRPFVWLGSFLDERKAPLRFTVDSGMLEAGMAALGGNSRATEPALVPGSSGIAVISGSSGRSISPVGVRDQLLRRARSGELPLIVNADVIDRTQTVSDADAKKVADGLNLTTANGLTITAGTQKATIPAQEVRSWIGSTVKAGKLTVTLDAPNATAALTDAIPIDTKARNATFRFENGGVVIDPSQDGQRCCAADTPARLLAALTSGSPTATVDLEVAKATFSTEDAQKLGIKEPVGATTDWKGQAQVKSFTTYYPCCAPRVTNIHRIADLIRGTLVKPGETFSVNKTVGQRTIAKGFVVAGAIANGVHTDEVGGGVSQFATTMFNAAFFAGLKFGEYQSHSEHFDRYPYGREATMGYEHPDLQWKNTTPYGILIWTSWTATSVTVTLYSTQYAAGAQTGQSTSHSGSCTTVTTQRTITYVDGRTESDSVRARYRDAGATHC
jgi:vancomycin resistance protein YoaR